MLGVMPTPDLHLHRKRRTINAPTFQMTPRDIALVEAVHRYRLLERRQVEDLFFSPTPGRHTNTNRSRERLRLLYQHGYLERIHRFTHPAEGSQGPVYRLGVNGAKLLAEQAGVPVGQFHYWGRGDDKDARQTRVQPLFLEHGLALADLRIAIEQSAKRNGCWLEMWLDDVELRHPDYGDAVTVYSLPDGKSERVPITPDSYFVLATPRGRGCFFVEIDRSTETVQKTWRRKILGYKQYILSGQFHKRYGVPWPHTPLRVLTTTLSIARARNLKAAAERYGPPEATQPFLFAPAQQIMEGDVLTTVLWLRAGSTDLCRLL